MDTSRSKREDPLSGSGRGPMRRSSGDDRRIIQHRHIPVRENNSLDMNVVGCSVCW